MSQSHNTMLQLIKQNLKGRLVFAFLMQPSGHPWNSLHCSRQHVDYGLIARELLYTSR